MWGNARRSAGCAEAVVSAALVNFELALLSADIILLRLLALPPRSLINITLCLRSLGVKANSSLRLPAHLHVSSPLLPLPQSVDSED